MNNMNRLRKKYEEEVAPKLKSEFGIGSLMALPKITKVVVNAGIGEVAKNKEMLTQFKNELAVITGQMPQTRAAKVSVASFGLRRGMIVGLRVSLRGEKMYAFLDKLFSIVLPRLRDFRGVSVKSFDAQGNYTLGIAEHTVFPEVDISKSQPRGLEITIVTNTKDNKEALKLLEYLGMPFEKTG